MIGIARGALLPSLAIVLLHNAGTADESKDNVPPRGFTALFNGKDLSGWQGLIELPRRDKMSPGERAKAQKAANDKYLPHWTVKEGVIHYDGKGQSLCVLPSYQPRREPEQDITSCAIADTMALRGINNQSAQCIQPFFCVSGCQGVGAGYKDGKERKGR